MQVARWWCATWWPEPFEGLDKYDACRHSCARSPRVLRAEATHEPRYYDVVHSLLAVGQVGWLARDRWAVPLVHTAHTLAAMKNATHSRRGLTRAAALFDEQQVVDEADRLIVNTEHEKHSNWFRCTTPTRPGSTWCIPGRRPRPVHTGDRNRARGARHGIPSDEQVVKRRRTHPALKARTSCCAPPQAARVRVLVAVGPSGSGLAEPDTLVRLADELGITDRVTFLPPRSANNWSMCTAPPIWLRCRAIRNRSAWSRSKPRPAAR